MRLFVFACVAVAATAMYACTGSDTAPEQHSPATSAAPQATHAPSATVTPAPPTAPPTPNPTTAPTPEPTIIAPTATQAPVSLRGILEVDTNGSLILRADTGELHLLTFAESARYTQFNGKTVVVRGAPEENGRIAAEQIDILN